MKSLLYLMFLNLVGCVLYCQETDSNADMELIRNTVLDYAETYYTGEVSRMERALSPDLNKVIPVYLETPDKIALAYMTYSQLVENAITKSESPEKVREEFDVKILKADRNIANVRLSTENFRDYLQMVKLNGSWKIVNVLWTAGLDSGQKESVAKEEVVKEILESAHKYAKGILFPNPEYLEIAIHPEFNKITVKKTNGSNRKLLKRQRSELLVANAYYPGEKEDTINLKYDIHILDTMSDLTIVEIVFPFRTEYLQFFRSSDGRWKAINCITEE